MSSRRPQATSQGFTLLEVLVVLVIIGLLAGLLSVAVRPDDQAVLDVETERLARLLELAADESRASGQAVAWTVQAPGYRFWQHGPDTGWTEMTGQDLLRARSLPERMAIVGLRIENTRSDGPIRLEFSADGSASAFTIGLQLGTASSAIAGSPIGDIAVVQGQGERHGRPDLP